MGPAGRAARALLPGVFEEPLEAPELSEEVESRLRAALADDVAALRVLSERPFDEWSM